MQVLAMKPTPKTPVVVTLRDKIGPGLTGLGDMLGDVLIAGEVDDDSRQVLAHVRRSLMELGAGFASLPARLRA